MSAVALLAPEAITLRIAAVRDQRVLLDTDLAALYDRQTKRFNDAVAWPVPQVLAVRATKGDRPLFPVE
jgi:ORF6N domain